MRNIYTEVHNCAEEFLDNFEGKINLRPAMDEFACEVISKAVFCVDSRDGFIEAANEVYNLSGFSCKYKYIYRRAFLICPGVVNLMVSIINRTPV